MRRACRHDIRHARRIECRDLLAKVFVTPTCAPDIACGVTGAHVGWLHHMPAEAEPMRGQGSLNEQSRGADISTKRSALKSKVLVRQYVERWSVAQRGQKKEGPATGKAGQSVRS